MHTSCHTTQTQAQKKLNNQIGEEQLMSGRPEKFDKDYNAHKYFDSEGVDYSVKSLSPQELALRNSLMDHMSKNGMDFITDVEEGQRVLDEANGKARLMAFGDSYDYDAYPLGRAEPGLADKEVEVVNADANHGFKNFNEARSWAKQNLSKTYGNEETGGKGDIRISNSAIDKFLSQSAIGKSDDKDVHLAVLRVLPDVLRTSIDVETHPDFLKGEDGKRSVENGMNKDVLVHRCYGAVNIDGRPYRVKITLKEDARRNDLPHNAHSYEATKIELLEGTLVKPEGDNPNTSNSITGAKLLKNVEMSYNPSEKVLDASGKRAEKPRQIYNPRWFIAPVRGGWTKKKILQRLKDMRGSRRGFGVAAEFISEFDSPQELADHMFYHGTVYGHGSLKPSITMSDRKFERIGYGGGGYGERYWGVSVSKSKRVASHFSGTSRNVDIYPIILAKGAKVKEMPELDDARDLDDHIVDLWTEGVDAVWIGDKNGGEQELCVINPHAIVNIDSPDSYRVFGLGTERNPIKTIDEAGIERMYEIAKKYVAEKSKLPTEPERPFLTLDEPMEQYKQEKAEYDRKMEEYRSSEEYRRFEQARDDARKHIRFFRTANGEAYGFTIGGKIYVDPRIATTETPIHEYGHLWSTAVMASDPEKWNNIVDVMKASAAWDEAKKLYPELKSDDDIADEALNMYSGRRGAERLRQMQEEIAKGDGTATEKAKAIGAINRLKKVLSDFWKSVAKTFGFSKEYRSADEIADAVMSDLLEGVDPRKVATDDRLREQFIGETGAQSLDRADYRSTGQLGERGRALDNAKLMERDGKDAKAIKIATGWERGADGKWRYEIDDATFGDLADKVEKKIEEATKNGKPLSSIKIAPTTLSKLIGEDHPIIKAHPQLKNTKIVFKDLKSDSLYAQYEWQYNTITINSFMAKNLGLKSNLKTALAHEVQHAIQKIEVFERGGDPDKLGYDKYHRLAGEVEARNVQSRMGMSPEERRSSLASETEDVSREDQIFLDHDVDFSKKDGRTLAGVHNITEDNLRKVLKMGGFANPSLAVIDTAKNSHESYGEISFVAPSALLDGQKTWMTDAYTQRYPNVEGYLSEQGYKKFNNWIDEFDIPKEDKDRLKLDTRTALEDSRDMPWKFLYLKERGVDDGLITGYRSSVDYNWQQFFGQHGSAKDIMRDMKKDPELKDAVNEIVHTALYSEVYNDIANKVLQQIKEETGRELTRIHKEVRDRVRDILYNGGVYDKLLSGDPTEEDIRRILNEKWKMHEDTKRFDLELSKVKARNYLESHNLGTDYLRWMSDKLDSFGRKGRLFKGYTYDGSRRYVPETLENVSKEMNARSGDKANGSEDNSLGSFIAKLADQMGSLDDIRKNRDKLASRIEKSEFFREWQGAYEELIEDLGGDPFSAHRRLHDIVNHRNMKSYAKKEYGIELSDTFMNHLKAFKEAVKNDLKSPYFETKFERPVYLNEFAAAVVPERLGSDVRNALEESGLTLFDYDPSVEGDRKRAFDEAINSRNDVQFSKKSMNARSRDDMWGRIDKVMMNINPNVDGRQLREERARKLEEIANERKDLYESVLSGNFDDVTLQKINNYLDNVSPNNRYWRPLSQRIPQEVERSMRKGERTGAVDVLFSRISESADKENGRAGAEAGRRIKAKKEELLKKWAIATGNWHESVTDFVEDTTPIGSGKDSTVYRSKDGKHVVKVSKGKYDGKFPPDLDQVALFNYVFPNSRYSILGYGEENGKFVKYLEQPVVDFSEVEPLTVDERVEYMRDMGFEPINKEKTAFSNGEIVASDLQKNNIVRDGGGNVRVIDADMKLHLKEYGGEYDYLPVEADTTPNMLPRENDYLSRGMRNKAKVQEEKVVVKPTEENEGAKSDLPEELFSHYGERAAEDGEVDFSKKVFGGNRGYVGYSISKRGAQAKEEGRFPKGEFKKEYGVTDKALNALVDLGVISDGEWHHTSMYGNKTTFYRWDEGALDIYQANKKEIDSLAREIAKPRDFGKKNKFRGIFYFDMRFGDVNDIIENDYMLKAMDEGTDEELSNVDNIRETEGYKKFYEEEMALRAEMDELKKNAAEAKKRIEEIFEGGDEEVLFSKKTASKEDIESYDKKHGTEFANFASFLESGRGTDGKPRFFHVGDVGEFLQSFGMSGRITIGSKAVNPRRHSKGVDHDLGSGNWLEVMEAINNPIAITRYNNGEKSFRLYTNVENDGKKICVGVDVKQNGRDTEVTNITTAFSRDLSRILGSETESLLYPEEQKLRQMTEQSSSGHNPQIYEQSSANDGAKVENISETTKEETDFSIKSSGVERKYQNGVPLKLEGETIPDYVGVLSKSLRRNMANDAAKETLAKELQEAADKYTTNALRSSELRRLAGDILTNRKAHNRSNKNEHTKLAHRSALT